MLKTKPEILAPAGSLESAIAAINCGADAIYLGAKDFNARKNAENFSNEQFSEIIDYAHERKVKVYQTLNTLIYDDELSNLYDNIELSCKVGVDALIVQDLAVFKAVKDCCPDMPLHASTQMSVHTKKGAQILKDLGFERVVLSREMSENEIRDVISSCDIQTEVFVHGALCMCVSGQCLMSAMIGQRSGNRGLCAQPCRLPFSSNSQKGRYDLSLKDLSLLNQVKTLKDLGVTSYKIEGRMKRPEYVAAAVTAFRQAIDNGYVDFDIQKKLSDVFSRSGFTDGYFTSNKGKEMFGTRSHNDVLAADSKTLKGLASLYQKPRKCIGLDLVLTFDQNGVVTLSASDEKNTVYAKISGAVKAVNLPCDEEFALKNLSKTAQTPYFIKSLKVENAFGMMVQMSQLNALRREVLEKISVLRRTKKAVKFKKNVPLESYKNKENKSPKVYLRLEKFSDFPIEQLSKVDKVILPIKEIDGDVVNSLKDRVVMELDRVKFGREDEVLQKMKSAVNLGVKEAFISNIGDIKLCEEAGVSPIGSFSLNVTNSLSLKQYADLGVSEITLSPELLLSKSKNLDKSVRTGIFAYGNLPLMVVRNCPIRNTMSCKDCKRKCFLTDRRGVKFPVLCGDGYSEILNHAPIYLADKQAELNAFDFLVLYFTKESKTEISSVIEDYTKRYNSRESITRGLYYRGSI